MNQHWTGTIIMVIVLFRCAILLGTGYAVFWLSYSGWWLLLAIVLVAGDPPSIKVKSK